MRAFLLFLLTLPAWADDNPTAVVAGLGGSAVADPTDPTTIRANPAAMALTERYDVGAMFAYGDDKDLRWGAGVIDTNTTEVVGFGVSYVGAITSLPFLPDELPPFHVTGEPLENHKERHDISLSLGVPLLERKLAFGLGGTLTILETPFRPQRFTGNMVLGAAARPNEFFTAGLALRDFLPIEEQSDRPGTMTLGFRGGKERSIIGTLETDFRIERGEGLPWSVRAGFDAGARFIHGRVGWNWAGDTDLHTFRLGIGASSNQGSLDYTLIIPVNDPDLNGASLQHVLSLTLKVNTFRVDEDEDDSALDTWPKNRGR